MSHFTSRTMQLVKANRLALVACMTCYIKINVHVYYLCTEFGGEADEEEMWEGPISEWEKEGGGHRHENHRDEL